MGFILRIKRMGKLTTLMILSLTFSLTIFNTSILQYDGAEDSNKAFKKMFDMDNTYLFNISINEKETESPEEYSNLFNRFNNDKVGLYNKLDGLKEKGLISNKYIYSPSQFDYSMLNLSGLTDEQIKEKLRLYKDIIIDYDLSKKMDVVIKQGRYFQKEDFTKNWKEGEPIPIIVGWKFLDENIGMAPRIGDKSTKILLSVNHSTNEVIKKEVYCEVIGIYDEGQVPVISFEEDVINRQTFLKAYFEDTFTLYPMVEDKNGNQILNLDENLNTFGVFMELRDGVTPEMILKEIEDIGGEAIKGNYFSLKGGISSLMESVALDGKASIILGGILIVLSLIGAISMMMGHLLRRKNEIGVKQSIGASGYVIYKEIFKDMIFITLVASVLSLYTAFMITKYIIPNWLILLNLCICVALGVLITILPVRGILKIEIVDLLRRKN